MAVDLGKTRCSSVFEAATVDGGAGKAREKTYWKDERLKRHSAARRMMRHSQRVVSERWSRDTQRRTGDEHMRPHDAV